MSVFTYFDQANSLLCFTQLNSRTGDMTAIVCPNMHWLPKINATAVAFNGITRDNVIPTINRALCPYVKHHCPLNFVPKAQFAATYNKVCVTHRVDLTVPRVPHAAVRVPDFVTMAMKDDTHHVQVLCCWIRASGYLNMSICYNSDVEIPVWSFTSVPARGDEVERVVIEVVTVFAKRMSGKDVVLVRDDELFERKMMEGTVYDENSVACMGDDMNGLQREMAKKDGFDYDALDVPDDASDEIRHGMFCDE